MNLYYVLITVVIIAAVVISFLLVELVKAKRDLKTSEGMLNLFIRRVGRQMCGDILNELQKDIGRREVTACADSEEAVNDKNLARRINFTFFADE